eukprot:560146-Rhodomonas_salina.1
MVVGKLNVSRTSYDFQNPIKTRCCPHHDQRSEQSMRFLTPILTAAVILASQPASAFSLNSVTFLPHKSLNTLRTTSRFVPSSAPEPGGLERKQNPLTATQMRFSGWEPNGRLKRRMMAHLLGAAGMAWPALANARLYDKLSKLDTLDPMDFNSIDSFFSDD